jgi:hypothetical protein
LCVAALIRTEGPKLGLVAAATLAALIVSMLGVAHAAAFIARGMHAMRDVGGAQASTVVRSARDCGCHQRHH